MEFYRVEPTPVTSWRMAVLMGANSRTYKFALGAALLDLAKTGQEEVTVEKLAAPYAWRLVQHADQYPQGPATAVEGTKDFLTVLSIEREASLAAGHPTEKLIAAAIESMPGMVMQKFHNLRGTGQINHSFYDLRGRGTSRRVVLSKDLQTVAQHELLVDELAARWAIVEASFDAGIGRGLVGSGMTVSEDGEHLLTTTRRVSLTGVRPALTGFQHGRCFYCHDLLSAEPGAVHVDHVYAFSFMTRTTWAGPDLNGVWNLVAACQGCNLSKSARMPKGDELERLLARNDAIAGSPHPLRRTLERTMATPSGAPATTSADRYEFVRRVHLLAGQGHIPEPHATGGSLEAVSQGQRDHPDLGADVPVMGSTRGG
ncbi:HNH endonuclease [Kocuria sp. UCD-OTCP]|uniref:HNH endonuclease n=1 Tax=Kocuria sp. UCD-OTCP TaxID=1292021 RepID=UPI00037BEBA1|nr:HNH endonuclease domain-containing protein [Kocuria sp. UCD-OTCP]EYT53303.1 hypothetical protein H488_0107445 [Kocuria sp. UCD-OTCP]